MPRDFSRRGVMTAGLAAGAAGILARPAAAAADRPTTGGIALTHVTVIDPHSGRILPNTTVVIRGDRIASVHRGPAPQGATEVDLRGRFVIPGLADMHAHAQAEGIDPALNIANGVTTVRDMAGSPLARDWRDRIEAGTLLGPRYVLGSKIVDGSPSLWDPAFLDVVQVADAGQAREAVRQQQAAGADFVKVYTRLSRSAYRALAAEARQHGMSFAGHCPDEVPLEEAADLGQASVEHLFWTFFDTSFAERRLRAAIARIRLELGDYSGWFAAIHPLEWTAMNTHSGAKARRVFGALVRRRTRQVPTLAVHRGIDFARTVDVAADPRNRYLPSWAVEAMEFARQRFYLADRPVWTDAEWAAKFGRRLQVVGEMHGHGVPIMTGTDTGTVAVYPGFSVHDELALLVEAGLPPMAALHAATAEPARFLGSDTGRVAAGHAADLVVLDADPLSDITNTATVSGVVVRGRYIGPDERLRILAEVERIAAGTPAPAGQAVPAGCPCHAPLHPRPGSGAAG
ncbi:amidohydrolase family protein [Solwaraspora sp. WMMB335]|uniref:amidohydrolase family protein n=1 Tax=Solwaraspora sp. WMMB335 TaxID=3404118 RepID=UPI003B943949